MAESGLPGSISARPPAEATKASRTIWIVGPAQPLSEIVRVWPSGRQAVVAQKRANGTCVLIKNVCSLACSFELARSREEDLPSLVFIVAGRELHAKAYSEFSQEEEVRLLGGSFVCARANKSAACLVRVRACV